jgi:hypothetical protein
VNEFSGDKIDYPRHKFGIVGHHLDQWLRRLQGLRVVGDSMSMWMVRRM